MLISYDPEVDIALLDLLPSEQPLKEAEEVSPGVILHFDLEDRLAQVELLVTSKRYPREELMRYAVNQPTEVSEEEGIEWAFQIILSDPAFKFGTSLRAPKLTTEGKRFTIELYERLTGRKIL